MYLIIFIILLFVFILITSEFYNKLETFIDKKENGEIDKIADKILQSLSNNSNNSLDLKKNINDNLREAYQLLSDKVDNMQLELDIQKNKMNKFMKDKGQNDQDSKKRNALAKKTRESFSKNLSKAAQLLTGYSPKKTESLLNNHLSKELTENNFMEILTKQPPIDINKIKKKNQDMAKTMDDLYVNPPPTKAKTLKNNYLEANEIKCNCDKVLGESEIPLGKILIQMANNKFYDNIENKIKNECGDISKHKSGNKCRTNILKEARSNAGDYLRKLSEDPDFACQLDNLQGIFPYNLKEIS